MKMKARTRMLQVPLDRRRGATLVEFIVVAPLLMMVLGTIQYSLLFHEKGLLNYAAMQGARAGSVNNGSMASIEKGFQRALISYCGGGRTAAELAKSYANMAADFANAPARIEIPSPTKESFDDYASPALATSLKVSARVIPNASLKFITCPLDNPGCKNNPDPNASGQVLTDADLLKLRITYGIPQSKQVSFEGA